MTANEQLTQALAELPEQFMPATVSWWPLAFGWWFLGFITLCLLVALVVFFLRRYKKTKAIRIALRQLKELEAQLGSTNTAQQRTLLLSNLSALLRKTTNDYFQKPIYSTQSGKPWRKGMDELINSYLPILAADTANAFDKLYSKDDISNTELQNAFRQSQLWLKSIKSSAKRQIKSKRPIKLRPSDIMLDKQQGF